MKYLVIMIGYVVNNRDIKTETDLRVIELKL